MYQIVNTINIGILPSVYIYIMTITIPGLTKFDPRKTYAARCFTLYLFSWLCNMQFTTRYRRARIMKTLWWMDTQSAPQACGEAAGLQAFCHIWGQPCSAWIWPFPWFQCTQPHWDSKLTTASSGKGKKHKLKIMILLCTKRHTETCPYFHTWTKRLCEASENSSSSYIKN